MKMQAVRRRGRFSRPDVKFAVLESRDKARTSVTVMYYDASEDFVLRLTEELMTRTALRLVSDPAGHFPTALVSDPVGHFPIALVSGRYGHYQSSGRQVTEESVKHGITIVVIEPNGEIPFYELEEALWHSSQCDRHTFFIWTREQDHHQEDFEFLLQYRFSDSTVTMVFPHATADRQPLFWDTLARFIGKSHTPRETSLSLYLTLDYIPCVSF